MRGLYIHIPFCRQACRYCDFFFSVSLKYQDEFVEKLLIEINERSLSIQDSEVSSLYLGGGTPSLLTQGNLNRILKDVRKLYRLNTNAEITIECNPEDLDRAYLECLQSTGINRLSIGIQSFRDEELRLLHRSHTADKAYRSVNEAAAAGFDNITVDLIYGIPGQSAEDWKKNLEQTLTLPVSHISAYHLTFEQGTVFEHWRKKGKLKPPEEELSLQMYGILREQLISNGFEHYEISNFAMPGRRSLHNQGYWSGAPYMGFGPSAHSFDGVYRSWNKSSLKGYMDGISGGEPVQDSERLTRRERYHDYLITSLRTSGGADLEYILDQFGPDTRKYFDNAIEPYIADGTVKISSGKAIIDPGRWLISDHILRNLFLGDKGPVTDS
jgi:oxygen-independent coproporphyrinogen-3 oxidase